MLKLDNKLLLILCSNFIFLTALDILGTIYILNNRLGAEELNPLINLLLGHSIYAAIAFKTAAAATISYLFYKVSTGEIKASWMSNPQLAGQVSLVLINLIYIFVVANNTFYLVRGAYS